MKKSDVALEEKLKKIQNAKKQSVEAAKESNERATDAAAQLAEPLPSISEIKENAKLATDKLADMQQ